jgi:hypothetical protein
MCHMRTHRIIFTVCRGFHCTLRIISFGGQMKSSFIYHFPVTCEAEQNTASHKALHKAIKIMKHI